MGPRGCHSGRPDLLDRPGTAGQGVDCMTRLLTDEEIERQLGDLADWRRRGNAVTTARIGARAKEQV